ncbi:hypothetical protein ACFX1Q_014254 [Malus domestica]
MLSGEGGTASSPRFKSKRRSEGPDIFKVLKEEEIGQIKILEVQEGSFHKRKFKCALKRTACLYKKSALDGISEIEEASSEFEEAIQKSKRQAQKSEKHLAFPDASAPITCKLSFAEITGNLSKRRSQISKRRQSFSAASTPVTCTLSLAEITDNLSKISDKEESRHTESFFMSKDAFPTKPLESFSVPYSLGYLCKPMTPKQKYLISPGTALEYSSPTAAILPKTLPHLPEE